MSTPTESVVYDVHDFKVYKLLTDVAGASPTYGAAVDVPGIASVTLDPNMVTAVLKGDGKIIAQKGRIDKVTIAATYGKVSLPVLGVITDSTVTGAKWSLKGKNSLPYFKAAFRISDVELGLNDIHVTLHKAQLTGGTLLGGSSDNFGQPTMTIEGSAVEGTSDALVDIEFFAAVTALPA